MNTGMPMTDGDGPMDELIPFPDHRVLLGVRWGRSIDSESIGQLAGCCRDR